MKNLMVTFLLLIAGVSVSYAQDFTCFTDAGDFTNEVVINEQMSTSTGAWNSDFSNYQFSGFNSAASGDGQVEFWSISPLFTDPFPVSFNFDIFEDFDDTPLQVFWSSDYSGTGDPNVATWDTLTTLIAPMQGADDYTDSFSLTDLPIAPETGFYIAFHYSDNGDYSRWRVSNITLTCTDPACCDPVDCGNFQAVSAVICDAVTDTYDVLLEFTGDNIPEYTITDNILGGTLTTTMTTVTYGPFVTGTDYSFTIAPTCDPSLAVTLNDEGVQCISGPSCDGSGLYIAGVLDGPLAGGTPKAVQFCTNTDIGDLEIYGLESVSNGGGSNGVSEYSGFVGTLADNECFWLTTDNAQFEAYFGFAADYVDGVVSINGDDALVLYYAGSVVDVFGDTDNDGTGECWEYQDGYAVNGAGAQNCGDFACENYAFSGPNALDGGASYEDIGENVFGIVEPFSCDDFTVLPETVCLDDNATFQVVIGFSGANTVVLINNFTGTADTIDAMDMFEGAPVGTIATEPTTGPGYSYTIYPLADETCVTLVEDLTQSFCVATPVCGTVYIAGVLDGPLAGGTPKAIHICTNGETNLEAYGFASANNGSGDPGAEFVFSGMTTEEESCFWLTSDAAQFEAYFGFEPDFVDGSANVNGDDALLIYFDGETFDGDFSDAVVVDVFGDIDADGTGECWDYQDGYAVNLHGQPNCGNFSCNVYAFSGPNALDGGASYADIGEDVFGVGEVEPACGDFDVEDAAICQPNSDYEVLLVFQGDPSDQYTITDDIAGTTLEVNGNNANFGPFSSGTVYSFTVAPNCDPSIAITLGTTIVDCSSLPCDGSGLYIAGVLDGPLAGGTPKAVQLCASTLDVEDLSIYGLESVSNGGGSAGIPEFTGFSGSLSVGQCIWLTTDAAQFEAYFGFAPDYVDGVASVNGDDAFVLYENGDEVDVFGDPNTDGTGQCWEYQDGYAINTTGVANCEVVSCDDYIFSGPNALDGTTSYTDIGEDIFGIGDIEPSCDALEVITNVECGDIEGEYFLTIIIVDNPGAVITDLSGNGIDVGDEFFFPAMDTILTFGPVTLEAVQGFVFTVAPNCDETLTTLVDLSDVTVDCTDEGGVCYTDESCDFSVQNVTQNGDGDTWLCSNGTYSVNAFCGGSCTEASELWLVSPAFNFGTVTARTFEMTVAQGFGGDDLTVLWSNDYDGFADPTTATWTTLGTIGNGDFSADISDIVDDNIYIGIQYTAGGGAGVTADYDVSNIQITSDDCGATALAPPPPCEANVGDFAGVATEICPCNGDATTLSATATGFAGEGFTQVYLLTNGAGLVVAQSETGDFDVTGQANGAYAMYAVNYENLYADEVTPLFAIGQDVAVLLASTDGCFQVSMAIAASINGDVCGCVVDCTGTEAPPAIDIVVCEGGNTTIVLGATGEWVINEFLANPFDVDVSDANNDGVSGPSDEDPFQQSQDEFVEFVNNTGFAVDISGWNFRDATGSIRHTFPAGTVVPNGGAVVLFGAGNPTGDFGGAIVQIASGGFIGINDGGDLLELYDGNNDLIVSYGYGADEAIANISQTLSPDVTGTFVAHDIASPTGAFFSPGTQVDGTPFTANNFVYNFYGDAALTDLLAAGVGFYDPQTAAGTTQTIYATTVDGECESEATAMTVTVTLPPVADVVVLDTLCSIAGGDYPNMIDLNSLLTSGTGGVWTNVAGEEITSFDATDLPFGDYSVVYTLSATDGGPCPSSSYVVTLRVINCGDVCDAFNGPIAQNLTICGASSTELIPAGAGLTGLFAPEVFISELHYDNASFDENEGVELTGTAGFNLEGYQLLAYNGNGGIIYETIDLSGTIANSGNGYGAVFISINGLQNGPDAIALVNDLGNLVEFISYEDSFVANEGPADGVASTDIGVSESSGQELGLSMQLTDAGWVTATVSTYDAINEGLTVGLETPPSITYSFYSDAALTDLLATGASYDPMTAPGDAQSVWVTATDGTCTSGAVEFTVSVELAPMATVQESVTLCNNSANDGQSIDLNNLVLEGPTNGGDAFWNDAEGNILFFDTFIDATLYDTDTTLMFTYNIFPENGESICDAATYDVSVVIETCPVVDPCEGFAAPGDGFVFACQEQETEITPTAGGNGSEVTYNFYADAALTDLLGTGASYTATFTENGNIYVTANDANCESAAGVVEVIYIGQPDSPDAVATTVCDDSSEGNTVVDFAALVSGQVMDENNMLIESVNGADLGVGTYTYFHYIDFGLIGPSPCGAPIPSVAIVVTVEDCVEEIDLTVCEDFVVTEEVVCADGGGYNVLVNFSGGSAGENGYNINAGGDIFNNITTGTFIYGPLAGTGYALTIAVADAPQCIANVGQSLAEIDVECDPIVTECNTPTASILGTTICNDASEGVNTVELSSLVTGFAGGTFTSFGGAVTTTVTANGWAPGQYLYYYTIAGEDGCDDNVYEFFVTVEDCAVDLSVCSDFVVLDGIVCADDNQSYYLLLTIAGGSTGSNGYNINVNGATFNNVADAVFTYGPITGGYTATVSVANNPQCVTTLSQTAVDCNPTALELLSFDGTTETVGNHLYWVTASERNTSHFNLLRSNNGINFEAIHQQAAAGNSNTALSYGFMDLNAPSGWAYYRLETTDIDGSVHVSEVVSLYRKPKAELSIAISPVPSINFINIAYQGATIEDINFEVVNTIGQTMDNWSQAGIIGTANLQKDISAYPVGVYFLTIQQGDAVKVQKFIKE